MVGTHLIIELYQCSPDRLNDLEFVRERLLRSAYGHGCTILGSHFHAFEPYGISGYVLISESHIGFHSRPQHRYAAIEVFTCSEWIDPLEIAVYLAGQFEAQTIQIRRLSREADLKPGDDRVGTLIY